MAPHDQAPHDQAPHTTTRIANRMDAAMLYAARGVPVFPCRAGGKAPLTEHGYLDATTDPERVAAMWRRWWWMPLTNIAAPTGELVDVLDLDGIHAAELLAGVVPEGMPAGPVAQTSSGNPHYYLAPTGHRSRVRLLQAACGCTDADGRPKPCGVDWKGLGGYVLVPPSSTAAGVYRWRRRLTGTLYAGRRLVLDLPRAPGELLELLAEAERTRGADVEPPEGAGLEATTAYGEAALERETVEVEATPEGTRNHRLNVAAFRMGQLALAGEVNGAEARERLTAAGLAAGLESGEVAATVRSGLGAGLRHRRPEPADGATGGAGVADGDGDGGAEDGEDGAWPEPLPLGAEVDLPPFPVDAFPGWLAEFVAAEAEATQTPPDLAGMLALAALSTAAARRVEVEVRPGGWEPVNLYVVVAQEPGTRKSAVFRDVTMPLRELERELVAEAGPTVAEAAARKRIAEQVAKGLEAKAAAGRATEDEALAAAMRAALAEVPTAPRLLADDATPEALTSLLADQGGRIAVLSPEGGVFGILAGRYSRVPDLGVYLKGHAGDDLRVDRKGRPAEVVDRPALTVGLAVQPGVLRRLAEHSEMRELGLLARFLYALPADLVGHRREDAAPVPVEVRERYAANLRRLAADLYAQGPATLNLTPDAVEVMAARMRELEPRLRLDDAVGDLAQVRDWAAKLAGATVRVAALVHLADHVGDALPGAIEMATLAQAARLADYLVPHALAAFDLMGGDPAVAGARYVLRRLRELHLRRFTGRDLFRATARGRFPKVADLDPVLVLLVEHDYLRRLDPKRVGSKGGRPPSPVFLVNPRAW
jgi:hypothetical protein